MASPVRFRSRHNGGSAESLSIWDPPSRSSGARSLAWIGVPETLDFALVRPVTLKELGLPGGTEWWVNVTGGASTVSNGTSLRFWEPSGTYTLTVASADKEYASKGGSFTVRAGGLSKSVKFTLVRYAVAFTESGLPAGSKWCVSLTGVKRVCTKQTSLSFSEPNGTYSYSLTTTKTGFSGSGGSFTVAGAAVSKSVTFTDLPSEVPKMVSIRPPSLIARMA